MAKKRSPLPPGIPADEEEARLWAALDAALRHPAGVPMANPDPASPGRPRPTPPAAPAAPGPAGSALRRLATGVAVVGGGGACFGAGYLTGWLAALGPVRTALQTIDPGLYVTHLGPAPDASARLAAFAHSASARLVAGALPGWFGWALTGTLVAATIALVRTVRRTAPVLPDPRRYILHRGRLRPAPAAVPPPFGPRRYRVTRRRVRRPAPPPAPAPRPQPRPAGRSFAYWMAVGAAYTLLFEVGLRLPGLFGHGA